MQIEAMVGELDVTSIKKGQEVRFTLESLPGRTFPGVVETLRMVPVVSNNVVSYTVVINVENRDGSLLPGMTCMVDFIVERSVGVLMVSNAALRYQPTSLSSERIAEMVFNAGLENMDDEQRKAAIEARTQAQAQQAAQASGQSANSGITGLMMGGAPAGRTMMMGGQAPRQNSRQGGAQSRNAAPVVVMRNLWYVGGDGRLEVMQVQIGITNGSFTEILSTENIGTSTEPRRGDGSPLEGSQVILRERI
jgi:HlyD family secretion protein